MIRKLGFALVVGVAALASAGGDVQASSFAPGTTAELANSAPGANSTIMTTFTLNSPDAMFGTLVTFIPPEFGVAAGASITDGSVVGYMTALMNFGLIGSACNQLLEPEWELLDASTNIADTVSYANLDDDGMRDFAEDENGDDLYDSVSKYPEPLTRILPGITPRARLHGLTPIAGTPYMFNFLVLEPGTSFLGLSPSASLGYPVVVTSLDNGDPQTVREPGAITDLCSYFHMTVESHGITQDNTLTPPTEGGQVYRTNPAVSGTYPFVTVAESLVDADGDGIDNELDVCPLVMNVGDPRVNNSGDVDSDGLDAACDPNDDPNTGGTNSDQDSDGYLNRQDNCPLIYNGQDTTNQADADLDAIGDVCDTSPATADGHKHSVCLVDEVVVGGVGTPTGPSCDADGDGVPDDTDNCPTVSNPAGQADDADGDVAGDACDAPGTGNIDCSGPVSGVSSVDALKVLRHNAGLSVAQNEPCLDIGQPRALAPPDDRLMGDVDCSGVVNSVDALKILRAVAGLSVALPVGCPPVIGPPQPPPTLQVGLRADGDDPGTDFEDPEMTGDGSVVTYRLVIDNDSPFPATITSVLDDVLPVACLDGNGDNVVGLTLAADDGDAEIVTEKGPDAAVCTFEKQASGGSGVQIVTLVTAFAQGAGPPGGDSDTTLVIIA